MSTDQDALTISRVTSYSHHEVRIALNHLVKAGRTPAGAAQLIMEAAKTNADLIELVKAQASA